MMIYKIIAVVTTVFFMNMAFATEGLVEIYSLAVKADPLLRQSELSNQLVKESKRESLSRWLPNISLAADVTNNFQKRTYDVSQFDGEEDYKSYGYSLTINQPIFRYDNLITNKKVNEQINQSEVELSIAKQNLIIRVTESYFDLLSAQDNLNLLESEKKSVQRQLDQAEGRLEAGLSAVTEVFEARAQLDLINANIIEARNQFKNRLELMREITDFYHDKLKPLNDSLKLTEPLLVGVKKWEELAVRNSLDVRRIQYIGKQLKYEIKRQKSGHYPTLDIAARYSNSTSGGGDFGQSDTENRTIALNFSLPIYQGGLVSSRTKSAVLNYEQNQEKLIETMRLVRTKASKAYFGVLSSIARIKALSLSILSNEKALNAVEAENKLGRRTITDVIRATHNLTRVHRDYNRVRYNYVLNRLKLKQSVGQLTEQDVFQVNAWLAS